MDIALTPGVLRGAVSVPSSKSFVHRQLIAAALAQTPCTIAFRGFSQDIAASAACIRALGGGCEHLPANEAGTGTLSVTPAAVPPAGALLNCGESGSTARFFLPVAAALYAARGVPAAFSMTGSGRLPGRPMADLCAALCAHGCTVSAQSLPLAVSGSLCGGDYALPGNVSSQYVTGLLLALPLLPADSVLRLTTPAVSAGYLEITAAVLAQFGVTVNKFDENGLCGWRIPGGQRYAAPAHVAAEGDWSNGAFWLCADAILKARGHAGVEVRGLNPASVQGDRAVLRAIAAITAPGDTVLDVDAIPDLVPVLAVLAAAQQKTTTFAGAGRLRIKESDRIATTCALLRALGGSAQEGPDHLTVRGAGSLTGGTVDGAGDHRIVMAAAVASLVCTAPVTVNGAQAADKSYPAFFADWCALGGSCAELTP